jgi:type I thyroxine 5'-deiodinase
MNIDQQIVFEQPKTEDERASVAEACVLGMELEMPMVLDRLSNEVDTAYSALPERLYTIDREGIIVYRSGPGPWGFDVDAFEASLQGQIGSR